MDLVMKVLVGIEDRELDSNVNVKMLWKFLCCCVGVGKVGSENLVACCGLVNINMLVQVPTPIN